MPFGVPELLGGIVGTYAGQTGVRLGHMLSANALGPISRMTGYAANIGLPNLYPDFHQALSIYYSGLATREQLNSLLQIYGIKETQQLAGNAGGLWWKWFIDSNRPRIPLDISKRAQALGKLDLATVDQTARLSGYAFRADRNIILSDSHGIPVDELLTYWWRGEINDAELTKYLRHAGYWDDEFIRIIKLARNTFSVSDYVHLYWQGIQTWEGVRDHARRQGMRLESDLDKLVFQKVVWPGPGEAINLVTISNPGNNYVARMQLDNELPGELDGLLRATGATWNPADGDPALWQRRGETLTLWHWRAHWQRIPPETAFMLSRRLRPTGGPRNGPRVPGIEPFTDQDLEGCLSVAGVPPGIRDAYKHISYSIPQRLYVKRLYSENIIDLAEVREMLKDQGYSDTNATNLATLVHKETVTARVDKIRPVTASQVKEAYRVGIIDRATAERNLYIVSLTDPDQIEQQLALPVGTYADGGLLLPFVQSALNAIDTELYAELAKQGIEVYHKAYLRGEINANDARSALIQMGVTFGRATQYVQLWTYELAAEGVEVSAAKLVDWYVAHLIDQQTLYNRLLGLHYRPVDANLIIASANIRLSEQTARLQERVARARAQEQRQLAAAAMALQKQQEALARSMCRSGSAVQVAKWAAQKLIPYPAAFERMRKCGKTKEDAIRLMANAAKLDGENGYETIKAKVGQAFDAQESNGQAPVAAQPGNTGSGTEAT